MKKFFTLGLNIFFEIDRENNMFSYVFKEGNLQTRFSVSDNILLLAEEVKEWEYRKQLDRRVSFFSKKFS